MNNSVENIQKLLDGFFALSPDEVELFQKGLTHSSNNANNNQRLAFLGDAVLKLIIREHICRNNPGWEKGKLTKKSEVMESNKNFAEIAIKHKLVDYMDIKNKPTDHETNETMNAEVLEALFGAIYISRGLEVARRVAGKIIL
ncbi:MAG: ribonuclease III domain-containing protein (plasmid) [Candidatus Methanoperedens sp.]|nr:MAG: ribonuclease III domain-containing protein [Candidatus Methanoperedens sp.]